MLIPRSEVVRRYFVVFSPDETALLKDLMILHPYYTPGETLWFTREELEDLKKVLRPEDVDQAILKADQEAATT